MAPDGRENQHAAGGADGAHPVAALVLVPRSERPGSHLVDGGPGGVGAPGGRVPDHDTGFGLLQLPARGLFHAMVASAGRGDVAFVGGPVRVRHSVVEVVVVRVGAATGGGTGRGTGPDQMAELAAGRIAVFGVGVVAAALGDRG